LGHGGPLGGYRAHYLRFPEFSFSVIILSNLAEFNPKNMAFQVADIFLDDRFEEPPKKESQKQKSKPGKTNGNILAHSPFFKAGIAGDGSYNRTLTPMTFQRENRFIWDAQDIYIEMSPFFEADHINTPMLMYHGAADNNSGTFLIQSERMIQALTGLGKNAVLYIYPYESHGPRCIEIYMDLWARWVEWFDKYVKNIK